MMKPFFPQKLVSKSFRILKSMMLNLVVIIDYCTSLAHVLYWNLNANFRADVASLLTKLTFRLSKLSLNSATLL